MRFSTNAKNGAGNGLEQAIGASPVLQIRTGAPPANLADAESGTVLATMQLPADWLGDAANAIKALIGTWSDNAADADGIAGHFRIYQNDGTTPEIDGTCGESGSGADMILQNTDIAIGQEITVTDFQINFG